MTIESLLSEIQGLRADNESLTALSARKDEMIARYQSEFERLGEILAELKRARFGPRKERWESPGQLMFNEAEALASAKPDGDETAGEDEEIEVGPHKRKRGKRKPLPEGLPREIVLIELPEAERVADDGSPLRPIGKEISEKLVYEPAVMKVIEIHRVKYGADSGDAVKTAPPPPAIIPKGIATASLLAQIVTQKYADGLPLYRQEEIFGRLGVELARCTMARWIVQAAERCVPVWNALEDRLLASNYVQCDETRLQVLKEDGRKAEAQSWMWARATPSDKQKIVLFDYDPHRSGEVAKRLFEGFSGTLQADGLEVYSAVEKMGGIERIGCNMHGRRRFFEAVQNGANHGKSLAAKGVAFYKEIYKVEEKARGLEPEARRLMREAEARPIFDEMKEWAEANAKLVPPKSKIGGALGYFLNEYPFLIGHLKDGRLEADNGFVERNIRKFAIGRNGWLFSDSVAGAGASALFYSLVVTAKVNGVDPSRAMRQVFEQVPYAKSVDDYERIADVILSPSK
jgi:transposase